MSTQMSMIPNASFLSSSQWMDLVSDLILLLPSILQLAGLRWRLAWLAVK